MLEDNAILIKHRPSGGSTRSTWGLKARILSTALRPNEFHTDSMSSLRQKTIESYFICKNKSFRKKRHEKQTHTLFCQRKIMFNFLLLVFAVFAFSVKKKKLEVPGVKAPWWPAPHSCESPPAAVLDSCVNAEVS